MWNPGHGCLAEVSLFSVFLKEIKLYFFEQF